MTPPRPHLILLGGFLGAGKTSAMIALGQWLADQGIRAGFITNDQGSDLVDTRLLRFCGMATEEIAGGCFCCRFNDLVDATQRLRAVLRPDVFVAEAVGSCTDLAATVAYPMRRLLGDSCTVAPLSVLVDAVRARTTFGLAAGETFSVNVQYIYRKQLEEADVIVIAKSDLLTAAECAELRGVMQQHYPHAVVLDVSVQEGANLDAWFHRILFEQQRSRAVMDVDYDRYADGERRLGWLNASVSATADAPSNGNRLLLDLAGAIRERLIARGVDVAHLKMTLHAGAGLASINMVRNSVAAEPGMVIAGPVGDGKITVNLRVEAAPDLLQEVLREALGSVPGWRLVLGHVEAFSPGRPEPTHRDAVTPSGT